MSASLDDVSSYLRSIYAEKMLKDLTQQQLRSLWAGQNPVRKTHTRPPTQEETTAFEEWKRRFNLAMEEGYERGWLRFDYDSDPEPWETCPRVLVYDETEEEYAQRRKEWEQARPVPDTKVTFPVYRRPTDDEMKEG